MTLNQLKIKQCGIIEKIQSTGETRRRMMEMGVIRGAHIQLTAIAPLGDPVEVEIKGYKLSLRKQEAEQITVKAVQDG